LAAEENTLPAFRCLVEHLDKTNKVKMLNSCFDKLLNIAVKHDDMELIRDLASMKNTAVMNNSLGTNPSLLFTPAAATDIKELQEVDISISH
jgi:hypothetical protein